MREASRLPHPPPRKLFSIERKLYGQTAAVAAPPPTMPAVEGPPGPTNAEVMQAVESLRAEFAQWREAQMAQPPAPTPPPPRVFPLDDDEAHWLRTEVAKMVKLLSRAKVEIAAIRHPLSEDDRVEAATNELDAIVAATEVATNNILGASEQINQMCSGIVELATDDPVVNDVVSMITDQVITIMEQCNFQDITGQRITKVVSTLQLIEERVKAIIDIIGRDAFMDLPLPRGAGDDGDMTDEDLLQGPQLENQGVTQDEIDALFA